MPKNTLFPGRPDYTGPTEGWFGLLHHDTLVEHSHNVAERVRYVKQCKPKLEITVRLHNMIYLGKRGADYEAKRASLTADYEAKRAPLNADYEAKIAPLDADYASLYADYEAKRASLDADYASLNADYEAKRAPLDADYASLYADYEAKGASLYADYEAKGASLYAPILRYIRKHIPDCTWDGEELIFPKA